MPATMKATFLATGHGVKCAMSRKYSENILVFSLDSDIRKAPMNPAIFPPGRLRRSRGKFLPGFAAGLAALPERTHVETQMTGTKGDAQ
jgi:hypothetical protein